MRRYDVDLVSPLLWSERSRDVYGSSKLEDIVSSFVEFQRGILDRSCLDQVIV